MKPKENHKKMWLMSAILLMLTIILLISGCFSNTTEIKLLPENTILSLPIPKNFFLNISNWWNIIFLLTFVSIFLGIIYFLEIRNKIEENSDFNHFEEETVYLKDGIILGIKIGFFIGILGALTILINPIISRTLVGIIFTSIMSVVLIGMYDAGTSIIETRGNRIKNAFGVQIGTVFSISLMLGIFSCLRDGTAIGMGIFLTTLLSSIIITMSLTSFVIILSTIKRKLWNYFRSY